MMNVKQDTNWIQNRFDLLSSSIFHKNTLNISITVGINNKCREKTNKLFKFISSLSFVKMNKTSNLIAF